MNNYETLIEILKTNKNVVNQDGELLKNKVQELARKKDTSLIKTLLSNEYSKEMFFVNIDGIMVFDINQFTYIVESQAFLPDSYTQFSQNIILSNENGKSIIKNTDVVLEFPNKDCVLEFDSTDPSKSREETFLNETLMKKEIDILLKPKMFVNAKKYDTTGVQNITSFDMSKDNLLIKGNNLLALHSLYPKYKGKIKLMYWDILYNTNNDLVPYNDSFKHSSYLTMMKNRLEIAQKLLKDDGVIVIQCDKNEDAYLKVLCDEIFGRDNFINHICIKSSSASGTKTAHKEKTIIKLTDTLLVYKNGYDVKINPVYEKKTKWDTHYSTWIEEKNGILTESSLIAKLKELGIVDEKTSLANINIDDKKFKEFYLLNADKIGRWSTHKVKDAKDYGQANPNKVFRYNDKGIFKNKDQFSPISSAINKVAVGNKEENAISVLLCDIWTDIDFNNTQNEGQNSLPAGKKPEALLKRIIEMFTNEKDLVLDAYMGSGTTASVCHKINRRYIGIEQLNEHYKMELSRLQNVINGDKTGISESLNWQGGGSFISCELAENSKKIIDKITNATTSEELEKIYDELKMSPFVLYRVDIKQMDNKKNSFLNLHAEDQKKFLISIIDKNTLYINYSDIDNKQYELSESDKEFTKAFYKGV